MTRRATRTRLLAAAALILTSGGLAACGGDSGGGDDGDGTVTIWASVDQPIVDGFQEHLDAAAKEAGITVKIEKVENINQLIMTKIQANDTPDIALIPQPGVVGDMIDRGAAFPLDDVVDVAALTETMIPGTLDVGTFDDQLYGLLVQMNVKSLVYYNKAAFEEAGYEHPESLDELNALTEQIKADGGTPWCMGIEADTATGWPATDWFEDLVMRYGGVDAYNQWVTNELKFDSDVVRQAAAEFEELMFTDGNVLGGRTAISSTNFASAGYPMFDKGGPGCWLFKQGSFIPNFIVEGAGITLEEIGLFGFPPAEAGGENPTLGGGDLAVMLSDNDDTKAVMKLMADPELGVEAAPTSSFISPHTTFDTSLYPDALTAEMAQVAYDSTAFLFDGSDQMPGEVGAGSFWREMTAWISGDQDLDTTLTNIDEKLARQLTEVPGWDGVARGAPSHPAFAATREDLSGLSRGEVVVMGEDLGRSWWRDAVIYEVYPRSFADANGDGEGDLAGLHDRLPYVAELGADAIWIAPWYPSPMADGGYDVSDYRGIHPSLGTLEDAEALITAAHEHGLRVIIDLVANHTSSKHPWFQAALAAEAGSVERARYLFRDGRGDQGEVPPNNWISAFGGSAWSRVVGSDGRPGQWYHHTFAPEQPDLDWENQDVVAEFDDILRFWLDRGVDGFRVDAAPAMGKAPGLPDADYGGTSGFIASDWVDNPHWDVESVHATFRRWRSLLDEYAGDRIFVAESVVNGADRLARYLRPDELHTAFTFDYLHAAWDATALRAVVDSTRAALAPLRSPATWALSSHDEIRHVTRLGRTAGLATDVELGTRRARAAAMLTLSLPGSAYLYQGEELGLPEVEDLPDDVLQDPVFTRTAGVVRGRDGCRVPLPWVGSRPPYGFSADGVRTWLPQPDDWAELTVEAQLAHPDSMLNLYRAALRLRRRLAVPDDAAFAWLDAPKGVLAFRRGAAWRCVVNLGREPFALDAAPVLASGPLLDGLLLPSDTAAWLVGR